MNKCVISLLCIHLLCVCIRVVIVYSLCDIIAVAVTSMLHPNNAIFCLATFAYALHMITI